MSAVQEFGELFQILGEIKEKQDAVDYFCLTVDFDKRILTAERMGDTVQSSTWKSARDFFREAQKKGVPFVKAHLDFLTVLDESEGKEQPWLYIKEETQKRYGEENRQETI